MMPGSKGQKAVHACMIRLLNLESAKHEKGVICVANQRFRMFAELREQLAAKQFETKFFVGISWGQKTFCPENADKEHAESTEQVSQEEEREWDKRKRNLRKRKGS